VLVIIEVGEVDLGRIWWDMWKYGRHGWLKKLD